MKGPPIDHLVYCQMFPKPKSTDPQNFQGLLQRQLVPEVRHETQAFYGHLSSQEAKYPGLDYFYQPHRNRLSRYPWHRRLFRAFDALRLTESEVAGLTKWEGTRWAKERFEREQGVVIRDTTGDGIEDWVEPALRVTAVYRPETDGDREMEGNQNEGQGMGADGAEDEDMEEDDEDSDVEIRSVGLELNERLRAAVAQREAGNAATVMDEEWEQWLKEAVEAGGIPFLPNDLPHNENSPGLRPVPSEIPPRLLNHPRLLTASQWQQIPDFLQNVVRQNMEATRRLDRLESATRVSASSASSSSVRLSSDPPRARTLDWAGLSAELGTTTGLSPPGIPSDMISMSPSSSLSTAYTGRDVPPLMPRGPLADTAP